MPPTSQLTYNQVCSFVTSYIRAQNRPAHEPVEGKTLIQACQDEWSDQCTQTVEEYAADRRAIVEAMKRMKIGGVLRMFDLGWGRKGFALGVEEQDYNGEQAPTVILGDVATSDAMDPDDTQDEDYSPPDTQQEEEDDTPRAVRGDSRARGGVLDYEEEEEEEEEEDDDDDEEDEDEDQGEEETPIERIAWSQVLSVEPDRGSQQESIEDAEAMRNQEAYAAMTANAIPLLPPRSEQASVQTPTRKRTRTFEIVGKDDSSSFDPLSPHRHPNSTPRRSVKRLRFGTEPPLSGSRRKSAPMGLWSPRKDALLGMGGFKKLKLSQSSGEGKAVFKEEKLRDTTAPWILDAIDTLHSKYPESLFEPSNGSIKCLDCGGRDFKMGINKNFNGFETHLRGKGHKSKVTERLRNPSGYQFPFQDSLLSSSTTFGMNFDVPQQPLAVFVNNTNSNPTSSAAVLGAQYFAAMEAETHTKAFKMAQLEVRHNNSEQKTKERFEKVDAGIGALNEKIQSLSGEVTKKVEASGYRLKDEIRDVKDQLDSTKDEIRNVKYQLDLTKDEIRHVKCQLDSAKGEIRDVKDQLDLTNDATDDHLKGLEATMTKTFENCEVKLNKMLTSMAKSDHRNIENIDDLKVQLQKSEEAVEKQLFQLQCKIIDLEQANTASQRDEMEASIKELKSSDSEIRQVYARMESRLLAVEKEVRDASEHISALRIENCELKAKHEQIRRAKLQLEASMMELEQDGGQREEEFRYLEISLQRCTDELGRQRDINLLYQEQVEAQFTHTEKAASTAKEEARRREEETVERERALEERLMGIFAAKLESMEEKKHEEERGLTAKKIQYLERRIKSLQKESDQTQTCMGSIVEDLAGSLQDVEELKGRVNGLVGLAVGMGANLDGMKKSEVEV